MKNVSAPGAPWRVIFCAAALLSLAASLPSQQGLQVLSGHVPSAVATGGAVSVGELPADQRLHLAITLPLRNLPQLQALLQRLQDPASPDYRHFLSVDQFTAAYGPTADDYKAVMDFALANGFTVSKAAPNRLVVDINGTVEQVNRAFHVGMKLYKHPTENRNFFAPDREPSLDLKVPVAHIEGLDNFTLPHSRVSHLAKGSAAPRANGSGPSGAYLAGDMRAAYYGSGPLTGAGQSVGLYELDGYNMSDVTGTFDGVSYSVPINNVLLDGAAAGSDGDDGEQVLDIVEAIGMAPGLDQVLVYIAPSYDSVGDVSIMNRMVSDNIAKQLSSSWGWNVDPDSDDPIFMEMAAQGQSFFEASGDYGAITPTTDPTLVWPSDDPNVIGVGATDLVTTGPGGTWVSESGWANSAGGPSPDNFGIPSWQVGVASAAANASTTLRNVPDIAAEGNNDNYLCDQGSCSGTWGGTSYAAPRWAGFMALVNQQAASGGLTKGLGFIDPAVYTIGQSSGYDDDFHDVTSGSNNCCGQSVYWTAVTGYDLVTGWGSPNGQNMIDALAPQIGVTVGTAPAGLSFSVNGTNYTSAHNFTWTAGSAHTLAVTSPQSLPPGTQNVFANWSDGGAISHTITVTEATTSYTAAFDTPAVLASPSNNSVLAGTTVKFSWTAAAGSNFTGYNFRLGTTPGASNVFSSGFVTVTSITISGLPTNGEKIYASLASDYGSSQSWTYDVFTATHTAALTSPTAMVLAGPAVTFNWTTSAGATAYSFRLGTTQGANNLYASGIITATSASPVGLPTNGETIYARLYTYFGTTQVYTDYTFTAANKAVLTSPTATVFAGSSVTFKWTAATGANHTGYNLRLGTTPGANDVFSSGFITGTSITATGLPTNGETIYVGLITDYGANQPFVNYTFNATTQAALTSPTATVLAGPTVTFNWNASTGATGYSLRLGTTQGANDVYSSGIITATSTTPAGLPTNGETIFARLYTYFGTTQFYTDYTFTAANKAVLTSPTAMVLVGSSVTFQWTSATGANHTGYNLRLGTTPGANDVFSSGFITGTSITATGLPTNGETIYVGLITDYGANQPFVSYTFTAAP